MHTTDIHDRSTLRDDDGVTRDALVRSIKLAVAAPLTVPYLVVGGVATSYYLPGRVTRDIDILVRPADAAQATRDLMDAGSRLRGALSIGGTAWTLPDGTGLDALSQASPWVRRALAAPHLQDGVPLIDLPYLIVMKLAAGRARDELDVEGMLAYASDDALADVWRVVAAEMPARVQDMESYLFIGRIERGEQSRCDS